jgi:GTP-binding protein LepA
VRRVPPPVGDPDAPLQALIIDSWFDNYVGVVSLVRVVEGRLKGEKIKIMSTGRAYQADRIGVFTPKKTAAGELAPGRGRVPDRRHQGVDGAPVGDTITHAATGRGPPARVPEVKPMVFCRALPT